jgi:hypothetical protein
MSLATSTPNPGASMNILSEKVSRALQVRTDTPAMKVALDALSHLHTPTSIDARTVRAAMEQEALHQAQLLQEQLRELVETVQELRQGVAQTAALAHSVRAAVHMAVITEETPISMLPPSASSNSGETDNDTASLSTLSAAKQISSSSSSSSSHEEQQLAAKLYDAFVHRDVTRQRLNAIHAFLETFDLSPEDSRLLDQYAFEDVVVTSTCSTTSTLPKDSSSSSSSSSSSTSLAPNGMAFLLALERVRKIRTALAQKFDNSSDHPAVNDDNNKGLGATSALRMMESLAQKQERAYERLYHWLQNYLQLATPITSQQQQNMDLESLDEALQHPFCRRALYTLRHVPAFYTHTLELVANRRRMELTKRFLLALTSGYHNMPPLEMKSHDPVGYVGDMLAFSFQTFSVEADVAKRLLQVLSDDDDNKDTNNDNNNDDDDSNSNARNHHGSMSEDDQDMLGFSKDKAMTAATMLSLSMSGLARPLKSRILQVIATLARRPNEDEEDAESMDGLAPDDFEEEGKLQRNRITHLYDICGLLLFYTSTMDKSMRKLSQEHQDRKNTTELTESTEDATDEEAAVAEETAAIQDNTSNPLIACLWECFTEATQAYEATVRVYAAMMTQLSSTTGESESALVHALLVKIADVHSKSPGFAMHIPCPEASADILSMEWVTRILIQAAIITCKTLDDAVALQQSIAASKKVGMSVIAAEQLDEDVEAKQVVLVEQLVSTESSKVLDMCGLGHLTTSWEEWQKETLTEGTLMAHHPGLAQQDVEMSMKEFYASLYAPPLPSLETTVKDPILRKSARAKIAEKVCDTYGQIYEAILSSGQGGGYDDVSFLGHTPDQVRTLILH